MKDFFNYENKICVVTGASSGMGKSTTEMLVKLGAKVYALDMNECDVVGIEKFIKTNLTIKEEIDKAFEEIPSVINCFFGIAGLSGSKTDYVTTFNCDFTANKYMVENYLVKRMPNGGSITFCTSTAGKYWQNYMKEQSPVVHAASWEEVDEKIKKVASVAPSTFAYIFAKRCLSQYSAEKSIELLPKGIRVNNVMPGATETGMKDEFQNMAGGEQQLKASNGVIGRLATSDEMGYPLVFLGSDMASFISGIDLIVDATNTAMIDTKQKKDISKVPATNILLCKLANQAMKKNK